MKNTIPEVSGCDASAGHAETHLGASTHATSRREPVKFVAYEVALELVRALAPVVAQIKCHSGDLADQIVRAASSVTLNLAEGSGRRGKDRKRFFLFAQGSAKEIRGALDTADAWGWHIDMIAVEQLLDRELRLLWGLTR